MLRSSLLTFHAPRWTPPARQRVGGRLAVLALTMAGAGCGTSPLEGIDTGGSGGISATSGGSGTSKLRTF